MNAWYTRQFRGRLAPALLQQTWPYVVAELDRCHLDCYVVDVTTDLEVPSYISAITPSRQRHRAAFGMASALTPKAAAFRALLESIHTWMWADTSVAQGEPISQRDIGTSFPDFESRVVSYGCGVMRDELSAFFAAIDGSAWIDAWEPAALRPSPAIRCVADRLVKLGHPVLLFDLTTADVQSVGLRVVRAICPTLQFMEAVHEYRRPNLGRVGASLGGLPGADIPHPFP